MCITTRAAQVVQSPTIIVVCCVVAKGTVRECRKSINPEIVGALHMRSAAIGGANIVFKGALLDCHKRRLKLQSSTQPADKLKLRSSQACLMAYTHKLMTIEVNRSQ